MHVSFSARYNNNQLTSCNMHLMIPNNIIIDNIIDYKQLGINMFMLPFFFPTISKVNSVPIQYQYHPLE